MSFLFAATSADQWTRNHLNALVLATLLTLSAVFLLRQLHQRRYHIPYQFPIVGIPGTVDFRKAMAEGTRKVSKQQETRAVCEKEIEMARLTFRKHPDEPFLVPFNIPTVILPRSSLLSLGNLSDDYLSLNGSHYDRFEVPWTNSGWVTKELATSLKFNMARQIDSILPEVFGEACDCLSQTISADDSWGELPVQKAMVHAVASTFGYVIVGKDAVHNGKWLQASIDHAVHVILYSGKLRTIPRLLHYFFAYLLPERRQLLLTNRSLAETIKPSIDESLKHEHSAERRTDAAGEFEKRPLSDGRLVRWLLQRYRPAQNPAFNPETINRDHYSLCFAAIHGPTHVLTQAIIDLAAYPEYARALRTEADRVLGDITGAEINSDLVSKLDLVDSFVRESAAKNPMGIIAWPRKTHRPLMLPTGQTVPANVLVAACNPLFDQSREPEEPEQRGFDGFRWSKLREQIDDARYRFGSTTPDSLIFGYGRHACVGRSLAIPQVKLVFAEFVRRYNVRLGQGRTERPANVHLDFVIMPPLAPFGDTIIEVRRAS